jgi:hypothetical protein
MGQKPGAAFKPTIAKHIPIAWRKVFLGDPFCCATGKKCPFGVRHDWLDCTAAGVSAFLTPDRLSDCSHPVHIRL